MPKSLAGLQDSQHNREHDALQRTLGAKSGAHNPYPASHTKIVGISTMLRDHDFFQSLRSHDQKKYGAGFLRNAAFRTCIESWGSPVKVLAESKVEVGELKYFLLF